MKKILIAAAAAGLMSLAACTPPAANNTAEVVNVEEANAAIYEENLSVDNTVMAPEGNMTEMDMGNTSNTM